MAATNNNTNSNSNIVTVVTHDGVFHGDDAMAVAMMKLLLQEQEVQVIRTRAKIQCDFMLDVGAVYDPVNRLFDHHQRGGAGVRENGIPFATAGLVWLEFGVTICGGDPEVAQMVDRNLIQGIDALDTGFSLSLGETVPGIRPVTLSHVVSGLNPGWHESDRTFDDAFGQAVEVCSLVLQREISRARGVPMARELVRKAISEATDPRVIVLGRFCPWEEVVINEAPEALFVIYPSETGDWRIQCVPDAVGSFGKRKPLPMEWAGVRGEGLAALTGVSDAIFMHPGQFIGGAKSLEGVLRFAELALN